MTRCEARVGCRHHHQRPGLKPHLKFILREGHAWSRTSQRGPKRSPHDQTSHRRFLEEARICGFWPLVEKVGMVFSSPCELKLGWRFSECEIFAASTTLSFVRLMAAAAPCPHFSGVCDFETPEHEDASFLALPHNEVCVNQSR